MPISDIIIKQLLVWYYHSTVPPSITMVLPVANEKPSLAIDAAILATSSGVPHLFIGGSSAALFSSHFSH